MTGKGFLGFILGGMGGFVGGVVLTLVLVGAYFFITTGGVPVSINPQHQRIAESFKVTAAQVTLTLRHVSSGIATFPMNIVNIATFMKGGQFQQSVWTWTNKDNIELVLTIWGPPQNSTAYLLEFGRLTFLQVSISSSLGVSFVWPANTNEGYMLKDINFAPIFT